MVINKNKVLCYIVASCFVMGSSAYLRSISIVAMAINLIEAMVVCYYGLYLIKRKDYNIYSILVCCFYIVLGIATCLGTKEYESYIVYAVQGIGATLFLQAELKTVQTTPY